MFGWLHRLFHSPQHEPEVQEGQHEQRQKFDAWESTMAEVKRVQKLAERRHADIHRPQHR